MVFFEATTLVTLLVKYGTAMDCPLVYRAVGSVCGTDGVTYPTLCEMEIARIFDESLDILHFGACALRAYCKSYWDPVCGTDLITYINVCQMEQASRYHQPLDILHLGPCHTGDQEDEEYDKKKRNTKRIREATWN